jgi:ABC-type antimicrobial peptide transport system permease subunit
MPFVYRPLSAHTGLLRVVVGVSDEPIRAAASLRDDVEALDPDVAVFDSGTVRDVLDVMLFPFRVIAALGTALGAFALVLAGVGLYGVAALTLARRRRELAVRVALGATPGRIVRLVVGDGAAALVAGLAVGVPAAALVATLSRAWLFGVGPTDPLAFAAAGLALAAAAAAAGIAPVLAAIRSQPWDSLRAD